MEIEGRVWKFGDHVDTDMIIPARFLNVSDPNELARNCFVDVKPDFAKEVRVGDIAVAGVNFGCGSSREHAPISIKAAGIRCVIARSFARIYLRNSINIGLPIIELEDTSGFKESDEVEVDFVKGKIVNHTSGKEYAIPPYPQFMQEIIQCGGWMDYVKKNLC